MNAQEVARLMRARTRLWPNSPTEVDAESVRLWHLVLSDVALGPAEVVLVNATRRGDTFPLTPGQIVAEVRHEQAKANGTGAPDVDEAWLWLIEDVRRRGWYAGPPDEYPHAAMRLTAKALGWNRLCHGDEMVTYAHFRTLYATALARVEAGAQMADTLTMLTAAADQTAALPRATLPELEP